MINPINPNKIQSSASERSSQADETTGRKPGASSSDTTASTTAVSAASDTLTVDKASALYRHSNIQPSENGDIDSPETAKELAAKVAEQFKANSLSALIAQSGSMSSNTGALLEGAPA